MIYLERKTLFVTPKDSLMFWSAQFGQYLVEQNIPFFELKNRITKYQLKDKIIIKSIVGDI